jgi:type III restriction enzyme
MRTLDYQLRVLEALDRYLDELKSKKTEADKIDELRRQYPAIKPIDFCKEAWEALKDQGRLPPSRANYAFSPRIDGVGRFVPNITLKVPTGGGKTWLAVNAVGRIMGRYLGRNAGFVLWVVPNEAIYTQTLKRLKDNQHPYRQALDRAGAGRVRILEKSDRLDARDVDSHLCVMVLMLQSANRQTQETLRMFKDRGDVHGFFPPEGEQAAHKAEMEATPNLDAYHGLFPLVKDSLGNALRKIRPVVVIDEGQKATSELAPQTLYGFNPIFVLELTATPKDVKAQDGKTPRAARPANLLVEVTGRELHAEDMIKMPLNLDPRQGVNWRSTLSAALDRLRGLQAAAEAYRAEKGELGYIRPIMLVQVERTGKEQRDGQHIHALDAKEWLLQAGLDASEIAIKTAEQNDLNAPENMDLLSPLNRVRVIITKSALQEGWDCPFAYVLCSLAAASSLQAMTQLVGRILRQPHAMKTGVAALDECYVVTHHAATGEVVAAIKKGLESDGLADLVVELPPDVAGGDGRAVRKVERRPKFRSLRIYLPRVLCWDDEWGFRELDYETDVLSVIDWRGFDPAEAVRRIPDNPLQAAAQLQRISLTESGPDYFHGESAGDTLEAVRFDAAYAVRSITDLVPNPFVGREIIGKVERGLRVRGFGEAKMGAASGVILDTLRKVLEEERDRRAEAHFKDEVKRGRIQFRLRTDGNNWEMPDHLLTREPEGSPHLTAKNGGPLERSLFSPIFRAELNPAEQGVAVHLDGEAMVAWWHRNVARENYFLQGWKRGRIYPDFIFAMDASAGGRIVVLETKGDHLQNPDTDYKREVMRLLSQSFAWDQTVPVGQLQIERTGETVHCALVLMDEMERELPALLGLA